MSYAILPERGLLVLRGEETLPFLQGLVSNDILRLHSNGIVYTALLTPQGKFLYDFFVVAYGESVVIDCEKARLQPLLKHLLMYRLRSKLAIEMMAGSECVAALWNKQEYPISPDAVYAFRDPRVPELGWRAYGELNRVKQWCDSHDMVPATADDYEAHRIHLGVPQGGDDLVAEKSFLQPFGFEDLHGVDFKKGCYVGQEVTARSKHLGQVRKFIYKVHSRDKVLPAPGNALYYGDMPAGELRSVHGHWGLAIMKVEEVEKARNDGKGFFCAHQPVDVILPAWVKNAPGTKV